MNYHYLDCQQHTNNIYIYQLFTKKKQKKTTTWKYINHLKFKMNWLLLDYDESLRKSGFNFCVNSNRPTTETNLRTSPMPNFIKPFSPQSVLTNKTTILKIWSVLAQSVSKIYSANFLIYNIQIFLNLN